MFIKKKSTRVLGLNFIYYTEVGTHNGAPFVEFAVIDESGRFCFFDFFFFLSFSLRQFFYCSYDGDAARADASIS